ncbi:MAG TPA: alpha/beta fold hydrolase, partial [Thermomicrobiales bacterium]|nr:alpha/beta fold hydrolase [Thermomicrobiales bacterium]
NRSSQGGRCMGARRRIAAPAVMLALALLLGWPWFAALPAAAQDSTPAASPAASPTVVPTAADRLQTAVSAAIPPDTGRGAIRLPSVRIDDTSDATVVMALRAAPDLDAFRAAAETDVFDVAKAVYVESRVPVRTLTVIGTYSETGTGPAREVPVLRLVLSRDNAGKIAWRTVSPSSLFTAADVYRFYPPFGDAEGHPIAPNATPGATPQPMPTAVAATPASTPATDAEEPPISSPFDIGGGRLLFLWCIGSGAPTVLLESGYNDDGEIWGPVQIAASRFVRICSYDRAGLSRSDPPPSVPRTATDVVSDLHKLLTVAGVKPPYILVGQGYGALFSRLFASTYPDEIAGMVLVDPWHEDFNDRLQAMVTPQQWDEYQAMLVGAWDYEAVDWPTSYKELRAAGPLPHVPMIVLSHGETPQPSCCPAAWPVQAQEQLWQSLQKATTALIPGSRRTVVPDAGDMIHQSDPGVVVDAIKTVLDAARDPASWTSATSTP